MFLAKDNFRLGLALGLFGPLIGLLAVYFFKFRYMSFGEYLEYFMHSNQAITGIGTLSLLANLAMFALYVHLNKYETFKGIFIITLIYGISILMLKLLN
ncbi:MAG: hypothetical protein N2747_05040 [Chitinophagaceae bacterium]|nr:hypothetical protein [Chitinophagaceae bacterium]